MRVTPGRRPAPRRWVREHVFCSRHSSLGRACNSPAAASASSAASTSGAFASSPNAASRIRSHSTRLLAAHDPLRVLRLSRSRAAFRSSSGFSETTRNGLSVSGARRSASNCRRSWSLWHMDEVAQVEVHSILMGPIVVPSGPACHVHVTV